MSMLIFLFLEPTQICTICRGYEIYHTHFTTLALFKAADLKFLTILGYILYNIYFGISLRVYFSLLSGTGTIDPKSSVCTV